MPAAIQRPTTNRTARKVAAVKPSIVDPATTKPFTFAQELKPFGSWVGRALWVPPKDSSKAMAQTMLQKSGPLKSKNDRWKAVIRAHRSEFTQVRQIELGEASIRLPKGKFFVTVTERENFDKITDNIPACVQTRLDEFMAGPGKRPGVKVYYLKPLCVEVGDQLILTTEEDLMAAVTKIQEEVFAAYRNLYLLGFPRRLTLGAVNAILTAPRAVTNYVIQRRQRAIDEYHAQLEFKRRKTALRAARTHQKFRTDGCTFDEMLDLTNPLERADVIEQYGIEHNLSRAKRDQLIRMAAGSVPWFVALALTTSYVASLITAGATISINLAPPVMVCDPAFVAEIPGSNGTVLKIGHFDEVAGVTHVEI